MDPLDRKAKFEDIKDDKEAVQFHAQQFERGERYFLARLCWYSLNGPENIKS